MNVGNEMITDLNEVLSNAWDLLVQGVASRKHGFHHAAVATIGVTGKPRIRTVILRAADSAEGTLRFHTDVRSQKCVDLTSNSHLSLVLYDEPSKTQVRVEGTATLHADDALADASWKAAQPMSKITYGIMPEPGLAIESPDLISMPEPQTDVEWARKHFVVVRVQIQTLQWLYLKQGGQRCAVFDFVHKTRTWTVPS
jgi:pyridoxamine 5'-phosphate oxidase